MFQPGSQNTFFIIFINYFLCNSDIGNEFHYSLQCQYFKPSRKLLLSKYYYNHVNVLKFRNLMTSKHKTVGFFCVPGVQNSLPFGRML
jgi:hypothetical protein